MQHLPSNPTTFAICDPVNNTEEFLKGFLTGLNIGSDENYKELLLCLEDADQIILDIEAAIKDIEHIDLKHWSTITKVLTDVFTIIKEAMADVPDCVATIPELEAMIAKIRKMKVVDIIYLLGKVVVFHGIQVFGDIEKLIKDPDWYNKGFGVGDLLNLVLPA